jgi:hypothetical protein
MLDFDGRLIFEYEEHFVYAMAGHGAKPEGSGK